MIAHGQLATSGGLPAVRLQPGGDAWRYLEIGDVVPEWWVPTALVTVTGDQYTVSVPPEVVPAVVKQAGDGFVDVSVFSADPRVPNAIAEGSTTSTVRLLVPDGGTDPVWVAPGAETEGTSEGAAPREVPRLSLPADQAVESEQQGMASMMAASSGLLRKTRRNAMIGSSYPLGESRARMHFSSSSTTELGSGVSVGGGAWRGGGRQTKTSGFTQTWNYWTSVSSYHVEAEYGLYQYCSEVQGYCYERRWLPLRHTGGTSRKQYPSSTRPSWSGVNCAPVSHGSWSRDRANANEYSHGGGVSFRDLIGIDLGVVRSYSSASRIDYMIAGARPKRMCGNNDIPGYASKVMERFRW